MHPMMSAAIADQRRSDVRRAAARHQLEHDVMASRSSQRRGHGRTPVASAVGAVLGSLHPSRVEIGRAHV